MTDDNHKVTSQRDVNYNCIAWAAGEDSRWWEPATGYHWPVDPLPNEPTVEALIEAYEAVGFENREGDTRDVEPGVEKIAIYGIPGEYMHAARQLPDGRWASKMGLCEDIEHDTLECLEGGDYGSVVCIMRRESKDEQTTEDSK